MQTKLTVSSPDDAREKEADAMADHIMRMPEPAPTVASANDDEKKLDRKERLEDEETHAGTAADLSVMRLAGDAEKEEETYLQTKGLDIIQRYYEDGAEKPAVESDCCNENIQRKHDSLFSSDVIKCSGRRAPAGNIPFEQSLSSSKGSGSALPDGTKQFMETLFNADFSGVRIHTGSSAEQLSANINAQAFTHGNDIYFNSGKYSPGTGAGGSLLAHELTHTIQQGASKSNVAPKAIARKPIRAK